MRWQFRFETIENRNRNGDRKIRDKEKNFLSDTQKLRSGRTSEITIITITTIMSITDSLRSRSAPKVSRYISLDQKNSYIRPSINSDILGSGPLFGNSGMNNGPFNENPHNGLKRRRTKTVNGEILVFKGDTETEYTSIDLETIRKQLGVMRKIADKPIKNLKGTEAEDYRRLVRYTKLLYDTDAYKDYHAEIASAFKDITHVEPGTVGAYFAGCLMKANLPTHLLPGCSVVCAGAMPPPKNGNDNYNCQYPVVWANVENGNYQFVLLNGGSLMNDHQGHHNHNDQNRRVILYVASNRPFSGLTDNEKKELVRIAHFNKYQSQSDKGEPIEVNVIRFSRNGNYEEVLNGFVPLDKIPNRSSFLDGSNSNSLLMLVIAVIVILIIGFIVWKLYSSQRQKQADKQSLLGPTATTGQVNQSGRTTVMV